MFHIISRLFLSLMLLQLVHGRCHSYREKCYKNACYFLLPGLYPYEEGKSLCERLNCDAFILTVHSKQEQNFLNSAFGSLIYHLGLEWHGGAWSWVDNTRMDFQNWVDKPRKGECPIVNLRGCLGQWVTEYCYSYNKRAVICKYYTGYNTLPNTSQYSGGWQAWPRSNTSVEQNSRKRYVP